MSDSKVTIEVEGLDYILNKFKKFTPNLARAIQKSIYESAYLLEARAKYQLTVGENRAIKTGRLRADTTVRTLTPTSATIGPMVDYAVFVHEGTRYMRARPFLKAAAEISQVDVMKLFKDNIGSAL